MSDYQKKIELFGKKSDFLGKKSQAQQKTGYFLSAS
jgi:hypothetical protein